ncbi:hypothetical protein HK096_002057, partial [Nowakowskiella sp. JEL0078]
MSMVCLWQRLMQSAKKEQSEWSGSGVVEIKVKAAKRSMPWRLEVVRPTQPQVSTSTDIRPFNSFALLHSHCLVFLQPVLLQLNLTLQLDVFFKA